MNSCQLACRPTEIVFEEAVRKHRSPHMARSQLHLMQQANTGAASRLPGPKDRYVGASENFHCWGTAGCTPTNSFANTSGWHFWLLGIDLKQDSLAGETDLSARMAMVAHWTFVLRVLLAVRYRSPAQASSAWRSETSSPSRRELPPRPRLDLA
jgi:hypothetical protein